MTKAEIARKLDEIIDFAGIAKYADTPIKRYSSGMQVRLGFAVAAFLEPEILIVDEVLAVGDAEFQKKAIGKMQDVSQSEGRTILFVSHNMNAVKHLCKTGILLKNGQIAFQGTAEETVEKYLEVNFDDLSLNASTEYAKDEEIDAQILSVKLLDENNQVKDSFDLFEEIKLEILYDIKKIRAGIAVGVDLYKDENAIFRFFDTDTQKKSVENRQLGTYKMIVKLPKYLKAGKYYFHIHTSTPKGGYIHNPSQDIVFNISEDSVDISFKSFASFRAGIIAANLDFELSKI
jgi:lipopolysaccharide transport system ATP-binding protein